MASIMLPFVLSLGICQQLLAYINEPSSNASHLLASKNPKVPSSIVFVSAFIDLGPESTDKTVAERLQHFRTLASSGIRMVVFVSPSYLDILLPLRRDYPNLEHIQPVDMGQLKTIEVVRSFPDLRLPAALTSHKDTRGFLELMLAKVDFVYEAMRYTDATHLAWIDFNIAHVFRSSSPLESLRGLSGRTLRSSKLLAIAGIWDQGVNMDMPLLLSQVNWRFAGGFFLGDRESIERWYDLSCDALRIFLSQTNTLVWEVNFWAWMEQIFPSSFQPDVFKCDHDDSLVMLPVGMDENAIHEKDRLMIN